MRYGTVLVVHSVGGLQEIVQPLDTFTASGMGWTFDRAEVGGFTDALKNAMWTYCDFKNNWIGIKEARNVTDLSWDHAAQQYEEVLLAAKYSQ
jgi:starch synthase